MRAMSFAPGAALAAIILSGCSGSTPVSTSPSGPPSSAATIAPAQYGLYIADGAPASGLRLVDASTGQVVRQLPMGTPSPDWSRVYAVSQASGPSVLSATDTRTGTVVWQMTIEAGYRLPPANVRGDSGGLSPDGRWLVLERHAGATSEFQIINTAFTESTRLIQLRGTFAFDGVNNAGSNLYLTESLAASQPGHYRVRRYDMASRTLDPFIVIDKREGPSGAMTGTRIAGLFSPDGGWQYSLYVRPTGSAFIHALNLSSNFAWCIDLPGGSANPATLRQWGLATRTDGSVLYAANPALGWVAEVRITDGALDVTRKGQFSALPGSSPMAFGAAALARDQHTLFASAGRGLVAIDTDSLSVRGRYLPEAHVGTLLSSPDGAWLYASSGATILQVDPASGQSTQLFSGGSPWTLYGVQAQ